MRWVAVPAYGPTVRFFRAVEAEDGNWHCRRGLTCLDTHRAFDEAIAHLREVAREHAPAALFAHWLDGRVEQLANFSPDDSAPAS